MVTSQLIWKISIFQQSADSRPCTHPLLIHFSPEGVAWSPNSRQFLQGQVKDSRYVDLGAKHRGSGDERAPPRQRESEP